MFFSLVHWGITPTPHRHLKWVWHRWQMQGDRWRGEREREMTEIGESSEKLRIHCHVTFAVKSSCQLGGNINSSLLLVFTYDIWLLYYVLWNHCKKGGDVWSLALCVYTVYWFNTNTSASITTTCAQHHHYVACCPFTASRSSPAPTISASLNVYKNLLILWHKSYIHQNNTKGKLIKCN